jgi:hypothetical protein
METEHYVGKPNSFEAAHYPCSARSSRLPQHQRSDDLEHRAHRQPAWRFEKAGGETAFDWTGHGYNAVLGSEAGWMSSTAPIFQ